RKVSARPGQRLFVFQPRDWSGATLSGLGEAMSENHKAISPGEPAKALWMSTLAFTICFAVWTIFAIIGIRIKQDLGLSEAEFGLLIGTPILSGSLVRIVLGIWTGRYGGRLVYVATMLAAALSTF